MTFREVESCVFNKRRVTWKKHLFLGWYIYISFIYTQHTEWHTWALKEHKVGVIMNKIQFV